MRWYAGTSGYSYKEWKGTFYPDDLPNDRMLSYYADRLPAVEINNTFYRMPRASVLESWAAAVPDHFRFVIKAPRRITHHHRLQNADEPTAYLLKNVASLEDKLGAVLFQLPPNLRCDVPRLAAFLDLLPAEVPAAFEFRHSSWNDPEVHALLAERGAAVCVADDDAGEPPERLATAPWLYLRLRAPAYSEIALSEWVRRGRGTAAEAGFVFFKHEDDGAGPAMAARFLALSEARGRKAPKASGKRRPAREESGTGKASG